MTVRQKLRPRARIKSLGSRLGWHVVPARDYDIARRDYYSPLPDFDALAPEVWERVSPMRGIEFDVDAQFEWAEEHLRRYAAEFNPPAHGDLSAPEFFMFNWSMQAGDAELLYAMVRYAKPARIIELGSGFSTLAMARAALANHADGTPTRLDSFNPFPPPNLDGHSVDGLSAQHRVAAQDVPMAEFESLLSGDILFVDTTHTVKIGSEVNRVILDVLPALAPGVLVHFHDILLPYEYPRWQIERWGAWNEQYLLQAFLIGNPRYEVLVALHAMARRDPGRLAKLAPHYNDREHFPTGFWIRARDAVEPGQPG